MDLALITAKQVSYMFGLMVIGMLGYHVNIINTCTCKKLTRLLLSLVLPIVIFISYQQEYTPAKAQGLALAVILSLFTHFIAIIVAKIILRNRKENVDIEKCGIIYSNAAYTGIPVLAAIYGEDGIFYATAYITAFNLVFWTHGIIVICGKTSLKAIFKVLLSPIFLSIIIGTVCYITGIRIPDKILSPLKIVNSINTPLAMIIAGVVFMQADILQTFRNRRIYYINILHLLFIPIIVMCIFKLLPFDDILMSSVLITTACPSAASITMVAVKYNKNAQYASGIFGVSSLLCIITIPIIVLLDKIF